MYDTSVKHNNNVIRIIKMLVQHLDEKGKAGLMDRLLDNDSKSTRRR